MSKKNQRVQMVELKHKVVTNVYPDGRVRTKLVPYTPPRYKQIIHKR
jgi:hypothetical protein